MLPIRSEGARSSVKDKVHELGENISQRVTKKVELPEVKQVRHRCSPFSNDSSANCWEKSVVMNGNF